MNKRKISYFICMLIMPLALAQDLTGVRIYINPGHGGHDSDDRNVKVPAFGTGSAADFWESESNLDKGLHLFEMVRNAGGKPFISRTTNTTEDDLPLTQIVRMANESESDFMLSIHSNAGGKANYILQLYAGKDPDDTYVYPTATPYSDEGRAITTVIAENQYTNKANVWGNKPTVRGDKSFARTAMGWSDGYGVLRGLIVPGTISEGSMHDYNPETLRLMNSEYKWLEAWHFFKSFCTYFKTSRVATGNIVGTIHDSRNKNLATFDKIYNSKDELLALNKATVTLNPGNYNYQTDNYNNGVYVFKNLQPGTYTIKYEIEGYYTQEQQIEVKENETTYNNVFLDMERSTPPSIVNYSPASGETIPVECVSPVILDFNWDIDEESAMRAFSITPQIDGEISFEDSNHRMIFTPAYPYEVSTVYHVVIDKSLQHRGGMEMIENFEFSFLTKDRNRLSLIASYPNEEVNKVHYSKQRLSFVFDRTLNTALIPTNIIVVDKTGAPVSQAIRSRLNNKYPSPLGSTSFQMVNDFIIGDSYEIRIGGELTDTDGIPFFTLLSIPFEATDIRETKLPVEIDFEAVGLLNYVKTSENNVLSASSGRSSTQKLFGNYSYEFKYEFGDTPTAEANYRFTPPTIKLDTSKKIGMYIYGDLSGNQLWIDLQAQDEVKSIKLMDMHSTGWEYREIPLDELTPGKEYVLTGFHMLKKDGVLSSFGQFYIDNLVVGDNVESGISNNSSDKMHVYPNPVVDWIYLNHTAEMKLYNMQGICLEQVNGKRLFVGNFPVGSYLLYVKANGKSEVLPILICR